MQSYNRFTASRSYGAARIGVVLVAALTAVTSATAAVHVERFQYVSPMPGSERVSIWNNVAIREGRPLDAATVSADRITVVGETSGAHPGTLALSDDGKTLIFTPDSPFALDEVVSVSLAAGVATTSGEPVADLAFEFRTSSVDSKQIAPFELDLLDPDGPATQQVGPRLGLRAEALAPTAESPDVACGQTPAGFFPVDVVRSHDPEPGYVFLTPLTLMGPRYALEILDNLGNPIYFRQTDPVGGLELQHGVLTFFDRTPPARGGPKYFAMDHAYALVDSFWTGNGYATDTHDMILLPNGHALLMSYDPEPVRMDQVVEGGRPNAIVIGLIIQEIDANKNVVFQWRSWDHYEITDVVSPEVNLLGRRIDYAHGNSIDLDDDGNILISARNMCEVTKIDRATGAIIWRWGLNARHNDFTFTNDTRGFSHQHHVRRLPNGHISMFNNGNYQVPQYSEGVEYALDEQAMTATRVWSYSTDPPTYAWFIGSVQRRASGGTMVGFGGAHKIVDVNADGEETLEFDLGAGVFSYRAFRFPWQTSLFTVDEKTIDFGNVMLGASATRMLTIWNHSDQPLEVACISTTDAAFTVNATLPLTIPVGGQESVPVTFHPGAGGSHEAKLYVSKITSVEWVAQDVALSGFGNQPPDCSGAHASADVLWPPNHQWVPVTIEGVTDADGDPVTIAITSVRQDEPVNAIGDGATCPDAALDGETVILRAERSASGNGRVIHVSFEASDGRGGSCAGTVTVCVPHDEGMDPQACGDDGLEFDALGVCPAPNRPGDVALESQASLTPALTPLRTGGTIATVAFTLPHDGEVTLALFDLFGRRVRTIAHGPHIVGGHEVTWSTSGLSPGVYYYRLIGEGLSLTRSIVLMR